MTKKRLAQAEYLWLDGATPVQQLRSKSKVVEVKGDVNVGIFPEWGFDGSSTYQATGHDSDLILKPVSYCVNPNHEVESYVVMCEVMNGDGTPHKTNTRAELRRVLDAGGHKHDIWMGFEQEYTLFKGRNPLGWPENGYPAPQGPFYCSVGSNVCFGRKLSDDHLKTCMDANLLIFGTNAEVMPGQWEFQVGYRGFEGEKADPLTVTDQMHMARWFLDNLSERDGTYVSFACKPVKGDWNGAGMHTNFSSSSTRDPKLGMATIEAAMKNLAAKHMDHIAVYGHGLEERLTGLHETCHITQFKFATADRGCSIRIPRHVATKGYGYFEDRRPGANADPYQVASRLIKTVCSIN